MYKNTVVPQCIKVRSFAFNRCIKIPHGCLFKIFLESRQFSDFKEAAFYIKSIDRRVIVVTSGSKGRALLAEIKDCVNVNFIYIFAKDIEM